MTDINEYRKKKEEEKQKKIEEANEEIEVATNRLEIKEKNGAIRLEDIQEWFRVVGKAHQKRDEE